MVVTDLVSFRNDLFFGGAVQLDWLIDDPDKATFAASNYVFHGPKYHGVSSSNKKEGYKLTDTASFTKEIIKDAYDRQKEEAITLAIAGYGTGKSHLGLTIGSLLSYPGCPDTKRILNNIHSTDKGIGEEVLNVIHEDSKPHLVVVLNGMKNFNLSSELSRQILTVIQKNDLPTKPLEDLWPRFQIAVDFCIRNYSVRKDLFDDVLSNLSMDDIVSLLKDHDEKIFEKVNSIYFQTVGSYINAMGQESPQELFQTVTQEYCGPSGYFESIVILFDEFGRYLEFAAQKPQVAGDAAIQQLFEAVQNNIEKALLVCFNQYELRSYLSRIASELQITLQRYITRFDSAKKYYLSSNLETLFAHLINKNDSSLIESYLSQPIFQSRLEEKHEQILELCDNRAINEVWSDNDLFNRVIIQGCWPLDPIATWMLANLTNVLQNRSSIALIKSAIQDFHIDFNMSELNMIYANTIASYGLIEELLASERFGFSGSEAEIYMTIMNKIENSLSSSEKNVLLAILLFNKLKITVRSEVKVKSILAGFSGQQVKNIDRAIHRLLTEFGVIEWNSTQNKYDLIGDAIPRSKFIHFLSKKAQSISQKQTEDIFLSNIVLWARLQNPISSFANLNSISTTEFSYKIKTATLSSIRSELLFAANEWDKAYDPNISRGYAIYCYFSSNTNVDDIDKAIRDELALIQTSDTGIPIFPFYIVPIHDIDAELRKSLSEYFILTGNLPADERTKYRHFIEDYKSYLNDQIPRLFEQLRRVNATSIYFHPSIQLELESVRLRKAPDELFLNIYNKVLSFPFDGFSTIKGNAAKDCREITVEIIKGNVSRDWLKTKTTQLQNRFINLLGKEGGNTGSWGFLDAYDNIKLYPADEGIKSLFLNLEKELNDKKCISVENTLKKWISPPFGMNTASAGLLLSIFISARTDSISLLKNGNNINFSNWIIDVLGKSFIEISKTTGSDIKRLDDNEVSEWKHMLEKWECETFYTEKIGFEQEAIKLEERIGLPAEVLILKKDLLIEQNNKAHVEIHKKNEKIKHLDTKLGKAMEYNDAGSHIYIASEAQKLISEMNELQQFWHPEDIQPLYDLTEEAKKGIKTTFKDWLDRLYVGNIAQLDKFEHDQKRNSNILRRIDLSQYARELDSKIRYLTTNLNKRRALSQLLESADSFLRENYFTSSTPIEEIEAIIHKAEVLRRELLDKAEQDEDTALKMKAKDLEDVIISKGMEVKVKQSSRLAKFYEISNFDSIDQIEDSYIELQELRKVFTGKESDKEDIEAMLSQLRQILDAAEYINKEKRNMSISSMKKNLELLCEKYEKSLDDEIDVFWNFNDTLNVIYREEEKLIQQMSQQWIDENIQVIDYSLLNHPQCIDYIRKISNFPPYLTEDHNHMLSEVNLKLQHQMSSFKVENIVTLFNELDSNQRINCLKELNKVITNDK